MCIKLHSHLLSERITPVLENLAHRRYQTNKGTPYEATWTSG